VADRLHWHAERLLLHQLAGEAPALDAQARGDKARARDRPSRSPLADAS
jgi:hypothetical protein